MAGRAPPPPLHGRHRIVRRTQSETYAIVPRSFASTCVDVHQLPALPATGSAHVRRTAEEDKQDPPAVPSPSHPDPFASQSAPSPTNNRLSLAAAADEGVKSTARPPPTHPLHSLAPPVIDNAAAPCAPRYGQVPKPPPRGDSRTVQLAVACMQKQASMVARLGSTADPSLAGVLLPHESLDWGRSQPSLSAALPTGSLGSATAKAVSSASPSARRPFAPCRWPSAGTARSGAARPTRSAILAEDEATELGVSFLPGRVGSAPRIHSGKQTATGGRKPNDELSIPRPFQAQRASSGDDEVDKTAASDRHTMAPSAIDRHATLRARDRRELDVLLDRLMVSFPSIRPVCAAAKSELSTAFSEAAWSEAVALESTKLIQQQLSRDFDDKCARPLAALEASWQAVEKELQARVVAARAEQSALSNGMREILDTDIAALEQAMSVLAEPDGAVRLALRRLDVMSERLAAKQLEVKQLHQNEEMHDSLLKINKQLSTELSGMMQDYDVRSRGLKITLMGAMESQRRAKEQYDASLATVREGVGDLEGGQIMAEQLQGRIDAEAQRTKALKAAIQAERVKLACDHVEPDTGRLTPRPNWGDMDLFTLCGIDFQAMENARLTELEATRARLPGITGGGGFDGLGDDGDDDGEALPSPSLAAGGGRHLGDDPGPGASEDGHSASRERRDSGGLPSPKAGRRRSSQPQRRLSSDGHAIGGTTRRRRSDPTNVPFGASEGGGGVGGGARIAHLSSDAILRTLNALAIEQAAEASRAAKLLHDEKHRLKDVIDLSALIFSVSAPNIAAMSRDFVTFREAPAERILVQARQRLLGHALAPVSWLATDRSSSSSVPLDAAGFPSVQPQQHGGCLRVFPAQSDADIEEIALAWMAELLRQFKSESHGLLLSSPPGFAVMADSSQADVVHCLPTFGVVDGSKGHLPRAAGGYPPGTFWGFFSSSTTACTIDAYVVDKLIQRCREEWAIMITTTAAAHGSGGGRTAADAVSHPSLPQISLVTLVQLLSTRFSVPADPSALVAHVYADDARFNAHHPLSRGGSAAATVLLGLSARRPGGGGIALGQHVDDEKPDGVVVPTVGPSPSLPTSTSSSTLTAGGVTAGVNPATTDATNTANVVAPANVIASCALQALQLLLPLRVFEAFFDCLAFVAASLSGGSGSIDVASCVYYDMYSCESLLEVMTEALLDLRLGNVVAPMETLQAACRQQGSAPLSHNAAIGRGTNSAAIATGRKLQLEEPLGEAATSASTSRIGAASQGPTPGGKGPGTGATQQPPVVAWPPLSAQPWTVLPATAKWFPFLDIFSASSNASHALWPAPSALLSSSTSPLGAIRPEQDDPSSTRQVASATFGPPSAPPPLFLSLRDCIASIRGPLLQCLLQEHYRLVREVTQIVLSCCFSTAALRRPEDSFHHSEGGIWAPLGQDPGFSPPNALKSRDPPEGSPSPQLPSPQSQQHGTAAGRRKSLVSFPIDGATPLPSTDRGGMGADALASTMANQTMNSAAPASTSRMASPAKTVTSGASGPKVARLVHKLAEDKLYVSTSDLDQALRQRRFVSVIASPIIKPDGSLTANVAQALGGAKGGDANLSRAASFSNSQNSGSNAVGDGGPQPPRSQSRAVSSMRQDSSSLGGRRATSRSASGGLRAASQNDCADGRGSGPPPPPVERGGVRIVEIAYSAGLLGDELCTGQRGRLLSACLRDTGFDIQRTVLVDPRGGPLDDPLTACHVHPYALGSDAAASRAMQGVSPPSPPPPLSSSSRGPPTSIDIGNRSDEDDDDGGGGGDASTLSPGRRSRVGGSQRRRSSSIVVGMGQSSHRLQPPKSPRRGVGQSPSPRPAARRRSEVIPMSQGTGSASHIPTVAGRRRSVIGQGTMERPRPPSQVLDPVVVAVKRQQLLKYLGVQDIDAALATIVSRGVPSWLDAKVHASSGYGGGGGLPSPPSLDVPPEMTPSAHQARTPSGTVAASSFRASRAAQPLSASSMSMAPATPSLFGSNSFSDDGISGVRDDYVDVLTILERIPHIALSTFLERFAR